MQPLNTVTDFGKRVGIYAGSFNPFHIGHFNILKKAELLFDTVIVAQGRNPDKPAPKYNLDVLRARGKHTDYIQGLLTEYIETVKEQYDTDNVTIIRGLRNGIDLQAELIQYRYYQDMMPSIQIVHLICDKEFEHVSSSGIRALEPFGQHKRYLI